MELRTDTFGSCYFTDGQWHKDFMLDANFISISEIVQTQSQSTILVLWN
jgi:hypothetical protein